MPRQEILARIMHEIQPQTEETRNPISGSIQNKSFWDTEEHGQRAALGPSRRRKPCTRISFVFIRVHPCPKVFFSFLLYE